MRERRKDVLNFVGRYREEELALVRFFFPGMYTPVYTKIIIGLGPVFYII